MFDIDGKRIEGTPYKINVYGMPSHIPFGNYTECISNSVQVEKLSKITNSFGDLQYVGGICINGKIYCTPNTSNKILVYIIATGETYFLETGLRNNKYKFTGQILYDGKIYMLHRGMNLMLCVDHVTDEVRLIPLDLGYATNPHENYMDSYHYCGAISDQGYLYQPPAYNNKDVLKINMKTFEVEKIRINQGDDTGFSGAVKIPNQNKILFIGGNGTWKLLDCDTDTFVDYSNMPVGCYDMVYDPRHNILVGTSTQHKFVGVRLSDYSSFSSEVITGLDTGYGISLGLDGKYWHLEGAKAYWATYDNGSFDTGFVTSSDSFTGVTPYIAGQAIDTDGSIYGIPASGCMSKLTFTGVTKPLPDWMVSSQYYGKY